MPALIETIKEQGLVLVADTSDEVARPATALSSSQKPLNVSTEWAFKMPEGVNGVMKANGVLRFNETIDM